MQELRQGKISVYSGTLDKRVLGAEMLKIATAFPELEDDFFNILSERIVANDFTTERLRDAVANLLDNFKYPRPNIADIVGFDKKIKLYHPVEVERMVCAREINQSELVAHWIDDNIFWIKKTDCEMYDFKTNNK